MYLFLIIATLLSLYALIGWYSKAPPVQASRFLIFLGGLIAFVLSLVFLKFGAALVAALVMLAPLLQRGYALLNAYLYFKRIHTKHRPASKAETGMSRQEALEILGVQEGATPEEIKRAYYNLMQIHHPDKGGSPYFAKKLNEARERLGQE